MLQDLPVLVIPPTTRYFLTHVITDLMRLEENLLLLTHAVFLLEFMESEDKEKGSRFISSRKGQVSGLDIYTK